MFQILPSRVTLGTTISSTKNNYSSELNTLYVKISTSAVILLELIRSPTEWKYNVTDEYDKNMIRSYYAAFHNRILMFILRLSNLINVLVSHLFPSYQK